VFIVYNCHILLFLKSMFNVSVLLLDDALFVLLQKLSCYQLLLVRH